MAKQGFTGKNALNLVQKERTWALCVGSGISFPIFPLWNELAKKIVHKCEPAADDIIYALSKKMSAEVLLQAAIDIAGKDHKTFSRELADTLYESLFAGLSLNVVLPHTPQIQRCW